MYNSEVKERFIKGYAYTEYVHKSCVATFERSAPVEEELGKDFCAMSSKEAQLVIDRVGSLRGNNSRVNILYAYTRWCIWNKIAGASEEPLQTDKQSFSKIKQRMVSGPIHLQMCLDQIFEPEGDMTPDNLYRCFCWCAFMGITQREAQSITSKDVDFEDMVIRLGLESYPIYHESIQTFKNCSTLTEFSIPQFDRSMRHMQRADGNELLRGIRGVLSIDTLRSILAMKRKNKIDNGINVNMFTYNSLTLSGVFYRVYEKERAGITPDLSPLADATMSGKSYKFKNKLTLRGKQNQLANAYLEDYYAWKQVFC